MAEIQRYELPKTLYLDVSKWRCGNRSRKRANRHGTGETYLLNKEGFSCCLGQFSLQAGVPAKVLKTVCGPTELLNYGYCVTGLAKDDHHTTDSDMTLTSQAICINDDEGTTVDEKITALTALCHEHGRILTVINKE